MSKTIGVVLSGCGVFDGSEIYETVATLIAIDKRGAKALCMAPNVEFAVHDHLSGSPTEERRNVLTESARLARGQITDMARVGASDIDALIFPGGFGAAKNLSNFAVAGAACEVHPEVARLVREVHGARKPIGAICIAPAMLARALAGAGGSPATLTIGNDSGTARAIEAMGCRHVDCPVTEARVDRENKIVSTPAYMLAKSIGEAAAGIDRLVEDVIALI